jgi:hypothetical protein
VSDDISATARSRHWCLMSPIQKHGSEAADRLVMTSAEQCSDLDQETARIRASGRVRLMARSLPGETSQRRQGVVL